MAPVPLAFNVSPQQLRDPSLPSRLGKLLRQHGLSATDIEIEISNQCARLIANAVIFYNSAILSRLLMKYEAAGNAKALALITLA